MTIKKLPKFILAKRLGVELYEVQPYSKKAKELLKSSYGTKILAKDGTIVEDYRIFQVGNCLEDMCEGFLVVSHSLLWGYSAHYYNKHNFDNTRRSLSIMNGFDVYAGFWDTNEKGEPYFKIICKLDPKTDKFEKYEAK